MDLLTQRQPLAKRYGVRRTRQWGLVLIVMVLAYTDSPAGGLHGQTVSEYEVKAAFLYKFASFVEWPPQAETGPVCVGVVGPDPFGALLDQVVKGRAINGRPFVVRRFSVEQNPADCQIVFIGGPETKQMRAVLERLHGVPVLTVGEVAEFCKAGGMISFALHNGRVRFEINLDAAVRAQLKVSSKLLSVARIAQGGGGK